MNKVQKGRYGESLAANYLKERHYKILKRNWTCHWGEIDLITFRPDKKLVFIEVKYIESSLVRPHEQFTPKKKKSLERSINMFFQYEKYFKRFQRTFNWQLDLICITKTPGKLAISHYRDVFSELM